MKKIVSLFKLFILSLLDPLYVAITNYMARQGLLLCSVSLPNGAIISIASGYSAPANITALTNANPGIATATNTLTALDVVEITSGWSRLTNKIVRVPAAGLTGSAFGLEGYDTSLTSIYPAGGGIGTFRKITGWTQLAQILSSKSNGGEQQFKTYQFLESDAEKRIPTVKNASGLNFSVADDATQPGYQLASVANDDRLQRAIKILLPSGSLLFYNAYISLNKTPSMDINDVMACEVTLSLLAEPVRYVS